MFIIVASILATFLFYSLSTYVSYVAVFILYKGLKYRLFAPLIKTSVFIILCYTSIIADVILFSSLLYPTIAIKNSMLTILLVLSIFNARSVKGE